MGFLPSTVAHPPKECQWPDRQLQVGADGTWAGGSKWERPLIHQPSLTKLQVLCTLSTCAFTVLRRVLVSYSVPAPPSPLILCTPADQSRRTGKTPTTRHLGDFGLVCLVALRFRAILHLYSREADPSFASARCSTLPESPLRVGADKFDAGFHAPSKTVERANRLLVVPVSRIISHWRIGVQNSQVLGAAFGHEVANVDLKEYTYQHLMSRIAPT
ncbi:uncharacterized protein J3D65DRAFT_62063 [Phyllosticta citribraziliensis]|uniref:Uncharacterized protein n=1 Tax=Phyllosticta citribraziliensis TaxID=989973 RepID=A0ABR1LCJ1_9PEZI